MIIIVNHYLLWFIVNALIFVNILIQWTKGTDLRHASVVRRPWMWRIFRHVASTLPNIYPSANEGECVTGLSRIFYIFHFI